MTFVMPSHAMRKVSSTCQLSVALDVADSSGKTFFSPRLLWSKWKVGEARVEWWVRGFCWGNNRECGFKEWKQWEQGLKDLKGCAQKVSKKSIKRSSQRCQENPSKITRQTAAQTSHKTPLESLDFFISLKRKKTRLIYRDVISTKSPATTFQRNQKKTERKLKKTPTEKRTRTRSRQFDSDRVRP